MNIVPYEMLRVVFLGHGRHAPAVYGLGAAAAQAAPLQVVVHFTVGKVVVLVEARGVERQPALDADKTAGVEVRIQS